MAKTTVPIELSSTPSIVDNGDATAITIDSSERIIVNTANPAAGSAFDAPFQINGATVGSTAGNTGKIANLGFNSTATNHVGLGVTAYRASAGSDWTTTGIKFTYDIDNSTAVYDNMLCFQGGNVGIGTSSPSSIFHLYEAAPVISCTATNNASGLRLDVLGNTSGQLFRVQQDGTTKFIVEYDGNVGIGESSPSAKLTVNVGSDGNSVYIDNNGTQLAIGSSSSVNYINSQNGSAALGLQTNGSERMRINSSGNVSIATTSTGGNSALTLAISSFTKGMQFFASNGQASSSFEVGGTGVGSITHTTTSTAYNTSSDYRLKENVTYDWDATTRIKQLKPARFNFISNADITFDGFLAHEVSSIVPEAIVGEKDEVDDEGNAVYQGIDQSKLVPLLVKTIQELEARITALEGN